MFSNLMSETYRVVSDVYKKNSEETYSYILTYLYSKTSRIHKTVEIIEEKSRKELRNSDSFEVTKKLTIMILENFRFMFYAFDSVLIKILSSCLPYLTPRTFKDYKEVFNIYFSIALEKPYRNEKYYEDLFKKLCSRKYKFEQYELLLIVLKMRSLFIHNHEIKFKLFNEYIYTLDEVRRENLIIIMLDNQNILNSSSMLNFLIIYGAKNNYDVTKIIFKKLKSTFVIITYCNVSLCAIFEKIPLKYRTKEDFETNISPYRDIYIISTWGIQALKLRSNNDHVYDEVRSFLNLFKGYYTVKNNKVLDIQKEIPTILEKYFKTFLQKSNNPVYRLILKKIFQWDFITSSELTIYSRSYQHFMLRIIIEDGKSFYDPKLFVLFCEIFTLVECFREIIISLFRNFIEHIFSNDESFNIALECKFRIMYFTTKNRDLSNFMHETMSIRYNEKTKELLEGQKNKETNTLESSFDITSDIITYKNYINCNVGKYGKSLKSSINLEKIGRNRRSRLTIFSNKNSSKKE